MGADADKSLNLSRWTIIGGISFCIALVLLFPSFFGLGLPNPYEFTAHLGIIMGCAVMFIIGVAGLKVGSKREERYASQAPNVQRANPPPPPTKECPSCGQIMVFIAEHQRWYCPKENLYF